MSVSIDTVVGDVTEVSLYEELKKRGCYDSLDIVVANAGLALGKDAC